MLEVAMFLLVSSPIEAVQEPPCRPPPAAVCVFVDSSSLSSRARASDLHICIRCVALE